MEIGWVLLWIYGSGVLCNLILISVLISLMKKQPISYKNIFALLLFLSCSLMSFFITPMIIWGFDKEIKK